MTRTGAGAGESRGKEAIRRANLAATMATIREHRAISRAELVPTVGLSRTTVAELVTQLRDAGLIVESEPLPAQGAGRPSYLVTPSSALGALALNPESDTITAAFVALDGTVTGTVRTATPPGSEPHEVADSCARLVEGILAEDPSRNAAAGIGVAIPGQVSSRTARVAAAPRLGWREVDFAALLAQRTGRAVRIDNNVRLATHTEQRARPTVSDLVYLFGGAGGVGAGIVSGNVLLRGSRGFAGELGHMRITDAAVRDYDGKRGTVEALLTRDGLLAALDHPTAADTELLDLLRGDVDAGTEQVVAQQADALGVAIGNLVNIFDPELVLVGGFLSALFSAREAAVRAAAAEVALASASHRIPIEATAGVTDAVLIGAAELFLGEVAHDPLALFPHG